VQKMKDFSAKWPQNVQLFGSEIASLQPYPECRRMI